MSPLSIALGFLAMSLLLTSARLAVSSPLWLLLQHVLVLSADPTLQRAKRTLLLLHAMLLLLVWLFAPSPRSALVQPLLLPPFSSLIRSPPLLAFSALLMLLATSGMLPMRSLTTLPLVLSGVAQSLLVMLLPALAFFARIWSLPPLQSDFPALLTPVLAFLVNFRLLLLLVLAMLMPCESLLSFVLLRALDLLVLSLLATTRLLGSSLS